MEQLIIDRSKWRFGGPDLDRMFGKTRLLNDEGYMCCLGFYCLQVGNMTSEDILGVPAPGNIGSYEGISKLVDSDNSNSLLTEAAIDINDDWDKGLSNEVREEKLRYLFSSYEVDVKFVNEYPS